MLANRICVSDLISRGKLLAARSLLSEMWYTAPTLATAMFISPHADKLGLAPVRVNVVRSFIVEPVVPVLRALGVVYGVFVDVRLGGIGMGEQGLDAADVTVEAAHPKDPVGPRMAAFMMPLTADSTLSLAAEWMKVIVPASGKVCKCLAVDLDGVLWQGVVGEDSVSVDPEIKDALIGLYRKGVVLAICSKNNDADARRALGGFMDFFSAVRINWRDKSENLASIAAELNIGLDSVAFMDDSPVERGLVRHSLPEVFVMEPPFDFDLPIFERPVMTNENGNRGRYYAEEKQRRDLAGSEGYYRSLGLWVEAFIPKDDDMPRVLQLFGKVNQFNLTTHRHKDLTNKEVYAFRAGDRFGDLGTVGVIVLEGDVIESFLLSCRALGRGIEAAMLAFAAKKGARKGWFIPTAKNMPARGFYHLHGFILEKETADGQLWTMTKEIQCPEWIRAAGF